MRRLAYALAIAILAVSAWGQNEQLNTARGFDLEKSFQMGDFDTVNTFNGNLVVSIPIGPTFSPGGNLKYGFHLVYNGNMWSFAGDETQPESIPNRYCNAGLGWQLTLGDLVAPMDPLQTQMTTAGNWLFGGPDGAEHAFYPNLHPEELNYANYQGSTSTALGTVVGYTRDGSYMRLVRGARNVVRTTYACSSSGYGCQDWQVYYKIESPDGAISTFQSQVITGVSANTSPAESIDETLTYQLTRIEDRFGNYLNVSYSADGLTWTLQDGTPSSPGRTHTVTLLPKTFYDYFGTLTARNAIGSITLAGFQGGNSSAANVTYTFNYGPYETISKNCDDTYAGTTRSTFFLNSVTQPDGSQFTMSYNKLFVDGSGNPTCSRAAGHLVSLALPTGGHIAYTTCGSPSGSDDGGCFRTFPKVPDATGGEGKKLTGTRYHATTISARTLYDANNVASGAWKWGSVLTSPFQYQVTAGVFATVYQELIVTATDPFNYTTALHYDVDLFGGSAGCQIGGTDDEYSLPLTHAVTASDGLPLSTEMFNGACTMTSTNAQAVCSTRPSCVDGNQNPLTPVRTSYVSYFFDAGPHAVGTDPHPQHQRVVYNDDLGCGGVACSQDTFFDSFDGFGHYRNEHHTSNFPSTNQRDATTHYNGNRTAGSYYVGANPDSYMIKVADPWLPNVFEYTTTTEAGTTAKTEYCFNSTTAFLDRRRTWRYTDRTNKAINDILVTNTGTAGNVTTESYYGGDTDPLPANFSTCSDTPYTLRYGLTHHYTAGTRDSSQYNGVTFKSLDLTIDPNTGIPWKSRDTAGFETTYVYDNLYRPTEAHPPGAAWTQYLYTAAAGTSPASVAIRQRPYGTDTSYPTETESWLYFDSFGRSVLKKTRMLSGGTEQWTSTRTDYDILGRVTTAWTPLLRSTSAWETISPTTGTSFVYDRFGRTSRTTAPDGNATTWSYTGARVTNRTQCVGTGTGMSPCQANEQPLTTTETYDGHSRLISVAEPIGTTTSYGYDVGSRLSSVTMTGPDGTQQRVFAYDLAGLLLSEQHPELGTAGNGTKTYTEYDAGGHLRHAITGTAGGRFDLTYAYDSAERLTTVQDLTTGGARRTLKSYAYGTDNPSGNYHLGKLVTAVRHNYHTLFGGDVYVTETYLYGGLGGRVSERDTAISALSVFPAPTFRLILGWNDLGQVNSITYPTTTSYSTTARTVQNVYTDGLLSSVLAGGYYATSIDRAANGLITSVTHGNGETEQWTPDPSGIARPAAIKVTANGSTLYQSGSYAYDGSGNVKSIGDAGTNNGVINSYYYDSASRLRMWTVANSTSISGRGYNYDSFGNPTSGSVFSSSVAPPAAPESTTPQNRPAITHQATPQRYSPIDHQAAPLTYSQTTNHDSALTYDAAGDVVADGYRTFTWDAVPMMATATIPASPTARVFDFIYSADDERVAVAESTSGQYKYTFTLRDLNNHMLRSWLDDAHTGTHVWAWKEDEIWRGAQLLASESPTYGTVHYGLDHLGSAVVLTNSTGYLLGTQTFDPWGGGGLTGVGMLKFTGQERDGYNFGGNVMTAMPDYFHAREYDYAGPISNFNPRFLSIDPAIVSTATRSPQLWNRYAYAANNPMRFRDPSGKYLCNGTDPQCKAFEDARLENANSSRAPLQASAAVYGKPQEDNGIIVEFGKVKPGRAAETGVGLKANIDAAGKFIGMGIVAKVTVDPNIKGIQLRGAVAHEGGHLMTGKAYADSFTSPTGGIEALNLTRRQTELVAYGLTAEVASATNKTFEFDGGTFKPIMLPNQIQAVTKSILSKVYTEQELNERQVDWP